VRGTRSACTIQQTPAPHLLAQLLALLQLQPSQLLLHALLRSQARSGELSMRGAAPGARGAAQLLQLPRQLCIRPSQLAQAGLGGGDALQGPGEQSVRLQVLLTCGGQQGSWVSRSAGQLGQQGRRSPGQQRQQGQQVSVAHHPG
jgi:hypothetical protein